MTCVWWLAIRLNLLLPSLSRWASPMRHRCSTKPFGAIMGSQHHCKSGEVGWVGGGGLTLSVTAMHKIKEQGNRTANNTQEEIMQLPILDGERCQLSMASLQQTQSTLTSHSEIPVFHSERMFRQRAQITQLESQHNKHSAHEDQFLWPGGAI